MHVVVHYVCVVHVRTHALRTHALLHAYPTHMIYVHTMQESSYIHTHVNDPTIKKIKVDYYVHATLAALDCDRHKNGFHAMPLCA